MSRKNDNGLTDQQQAFCDYYRTDPERNGARAYRKAYPKCKSDQAAEAAASRLLRDVKVRAYLDAKAERAEKAADITEDRILRELASLAFFNPKRLYREDGSLLPIHELPDDVAAALSGVELSVTIGDGETTPLGTKKYRWHDKRAAIETLGKSRTIKAWVERVEHSGKVSIQNKSDEDIKHRLLELLARGKARRDRSGGPGGAKRGGAGGASAAPRRGLAARGSRKV